MIMKSDSDREVALFTEAVKVPREERDAFLDRTCRGNDDLRQRLEALLRAHDRLGSFLEGTGNQKSSDENN
jgi:hypothetical protein